MRDVACVMSHAAIHMQKVLERNERLDTDMSTFGEPNQPLAEGMWEDPLETRPISFNITNFVNKDKSHTVSICSRIFS